MPSVHSIFKPSRFKSSPLNYQKSLCLLSTKHPKFKNLIKSIGVLKYEIPLWKSIDDAVLYAVIGQMLSLSASKTIIKRLISEFKSSKNVIKWAESSLKYPGAMNGVSWRKRKALSEWNKYVENNKEYLNWRKISLEEYRKQITSVWGFGNWAADMIAIFYLGRMDVWPVTDVGLKRGCRNLLGTDDLEKMRNLVEGCETIAAMYLWESLNQSSLNNG